MRPTPHSHFSTGLVMSAAALRRQSELRLVQSNLWLVLLASPEAERTLGADLLPAMGRRLSQTVMSFPRSALSPLIMPPTAPARAADACVCARTGVGGWAVRVLGNRRPARVRKRRRMAGICRTAAFVCFAAATRRPVAAPRPASAGASTSARASTSAVPPRSLPVRLSACRCGCLCAHGRAFPDAGLCRVRTNMSPVRARELCVRELCV